MQQTKPNSIAIIGGGASAALLAAQLCQNADNLHLYIVSNNTEVGRGVAYSTTESQHLLNVVAGKMSAFANEPNHFAQWLHKKGTHFTASDFVPRQLYGDYLQQILATAASNATGRVTLKYISSEALDLLEQPSGFEIVLDNLSSVFAHKVVLALGNFPPSDPSPALSALQNTGLYAANPWQQTQIRNLAPDAPVLLIGSGLTMVDMLLSLQAKSHTGAITVVSTHGRMPNMHSKTAQTYLGICADVGVLKTVTEWVAYLRRHIAEAKKQGIGWQAVVDAFRPYSQQFWLQLPLQEKEKFMRHLRHIWGAARHRMPPTCARHIQQLEQAKRLNVYKGRVVAVEINANHAIVTLQHPSKQQTKVAASLIINCTGPESDYRKVSSTLVQNLLQKQLIQTDSLKMGLQADLSGAVINAEGKVSASLFSIGPPLKGMLWESTAIPEIRVQAEQLAKVLLSKLLV